MRITKRQLKRMIREEVSRFDESDDGDGTHQRMTDLYNRARFFAHAHFPGQRSLDSSISKLMSIDDIDRERSDKRDIHSWWFSDAAEEITGGEISGRITDEQGNPKISDALIRDVMILLLKHEKDKND